MAKPPAVVEHIPAHLTKYVQADYNQRFKVPAGAPIGRISLMGKNFTFQLGGKEDWTVSTADDIPMPFLDICIIDANENTSKAYWEGGYEPGSTDPPDCASILGDKPDNGVPKPQSKSCANCKHNKFGTADNGKGKRCGDSKRVAALPGWDFENEEWGGPMLLRIPPTSFKDFGQFVAEQSKLGRDLNLIITRIKYNPKVTHQQLQFIFQRWIDEEEAPLMERWINDEHTKRVLMVNLDARGEEVGEEVEEEPTPASAKARATTGAAEKMAAAKAQARTAAQTDPAPARPNGSASRVVRPAAPPPAEEPVPGPAKRTAPAADPKPAKRPTAAAADNVVPMEPAKPTTRRTATATPVKTPEPPPPEPEPVGGNSQFSEEELEYYQQLDSEAEGLIAKLQNMPETSPLYKRLYNRVEAIDQELQAAGYVSPSAAEPDEVQAMTITAEDEETEAGNEGGAATTAELLAALDDEDLTGVPE